MAAISISCGLGAIGSHLPRRGALPLPPPPLLATLGTRLVHRGQSGATGHVEIDLDTLVQSGTVSAWSLVSGPPEVSVVSRALRIADGLSFDPAAVEVQAFGTGGSATSSGTVEVEEVTIGLSGLTVNTTHGPTAQDGVALTGFYGGSGSATWRWQRRTGAGPATDIGRAAAATFTPYIGYDVADLDEIRVVATLAGQDYPGSWATVRRAEPVLGPLPDLTFTEGAGPHFFDLAPLAPATGGSWSLVSGPAAAGVSGSSLSVADAVVAAQKIRLAYTDSGGTAQTNSATVEVVAASSIALSEEVDGTITLNGDGSADITITSPARYAGSYSLTAGQVETLDTVPVNLVPPTITGNDPGTVGDVYAMQYLGLWAYDGSEPTPSYQWQVDGANAASETDEAGYVTDTAGDIRLEETVNGQTANSAAITVSAPAASFAFAEIFNAAQSSPTATGWTIPNANLGAPDPGRVIYIALGLAAVIPNAVTINGIPATEVIGATRDACRQSIWKATVPTGTTGNVEITFTGTGGYASIVGFRVIRGAEAATATSVTNPAALNVNIATGNLLLVAAGGYSGGRSGPMDTVTGFTATQNNGHGVSSRTTCAGSYAATATEMPRTVAAGTSGINRLAGVSLVIGAA